MPTKPVLSIFNLIGIVTGMLFDIESQMEGDSIYNVSEGWCNITTPNYYGLNNIFDIPRSVNITKLFSPSFYYMSFSEQSALVCIMQSNYKKINVTLDESNGSNFLYYRADFLQSAIHDINLALLYGAQYYVDIFLNNTIHKVKYVCPQDVTNLSQCLDLPSYINRHAYDRDNIIKVRIQVSGRKITFFEIYHNSKKGLYALERNYPLHGINKLHRLNSSQPLEMIIKINNSWKNWTDLITLHNLNYGTIRHNIHLVLKDCTIADQNVSFIKDKTNSASIKTYIYNADDLCSIVTRTGIYNLILIGSNFSNYIENVTLHRSINGIDIAIYPSYNISHSKRYCFYELNIFDPQSTTILKFLSYNAIVAFLNFRILTNRTLNSDELVLTYLNTRNKKIETETINGHVKIDLIQKNKVMKVKYDKNEAILEYTRNHILISYRYNHFRNKRNRECPKKPLFFIHQKNEGYLKKQLQTCIN